MDIENSQIPNQDIPGNAPEAEDNGDGKQVAAVDELGLVITGDRISVGDELPKTQHPNDVKFKAKYSKDFKGDKTFEDGSIHIISKESAEQFTKLGIGSIIK